MEITILKMERDILMIEDSVFTSKFLVDFLKEFGNQNIHIWLQTF